MVDETELDSNASANVILRPMRARTPIFLGLALTALVVTLGGQLTVPPVFLNHVQMVLPSPVYAEIRRSPFLKNEFSALDEHASTAQRDGLGAYTYTGIYLFGRHTYLECFETGTVSRPGESGPWQAGVVGFNLGIDDRSQLPLLRDRFAAEAGEPARIDITRRGTTNLPSYDSFSLASQKTYNAPGIDVSAIVKAYYADRITLDKQRDKIYAPDRLLKDVTAATVTVNEAELKNILELFRACGYAIRKEGEKQIASGPEVTFTLLPEKPNTPRILALDLSLNREKTGEQTYKFSANSELQFHGNSAKWTFTFPTERRP